MNTNVQYVPYIIKIEPNNLFIQALLVGSKIPFTLLDKVPTRVKGVMKPREYDKSVIAPCVGFPVVAIPLKIEAKIGEEQGDATRADDPPNKKALKGPLTFFSILLLLMKLSIVGNTMLIMFNKYSPIVIDITPDKSEGKSPRKLVDTEPNISPNDAADKPLKVSMLAKPPAYITIFVLSIELTSLTLLELLFILGDEEPKYDNVNGSKLREQGENDASRPAAYKNPNDNIVISFD